MKNFDMLLRQALMEANLLQFDSVLCVANVKEPDFSSRYIRSRMRLLSDPIKWMKQRSAPIWKKTLQAVACVLLVCSLTLGTLMAVSPTARATVLSWLREIIGSSITYSSSSNWTKSETLPSNWRITWMPENWELQDVSDFGWKYHEIDGKGSLLFTCVAPGDSELSTNVSSESDPDEIQKSIQVQGQPADYYMSENNRVLLWENEAGHLMMLRGTHIDERDFLQIAESVTFYEGPNIAYEMGWVPTNYAPMYRDELIGAAQEVWTDNQKDILWQYASDGICSFATPSGIPEDVTIHDMTGWLWNAEEPAQNSTDREFTDANGDVVGEGSTYIGDGFTIVVTGSPDEDEIATLVWTDSETNTTFFLEGALSREELLRMANSVHGKEPEPKEPSHNMMITSGTAGN